MSAYAYSAHTCRMRWHCLPAKASRLRGSGQQGVKVGLKLGGSDAFPRRVDFPVDPAQLELFCLAPFEQGLPSARQALERALQEIVCRTTGRQIRGHDLALGLKGLTDDGADLHVERLLRRGAKARARPADRA